MSEPLSREELGLLAAHAYHDELLTSTWPVGYKSTSIERWIRVGEAVAREVLKSERYCQMCGNTLDGYVPPTPEGSA